MHARDRLSRRTTAATAAAFVLCTLLAPRAAGAAPLFEDDFETGTLLKTDNPPGRWDAYTGTGVTPLTVSPLAAKRGEYGLRLTDAESASRNTSLDYVTANLSPNQVTVYYRSWIRVTGGNGAGTVDVIKMIGGSGDTIGAMDLYEQTPASPTWDLALGYYDASGGHTPTIGTYPADGQWHLFELASLNAGSGSVNGVQKVWFDGAPLLDAARSWSATRWQVGRITFGQTTVVDGSFMATVDFDDVRVSTTPQASKLSITELATAVAVGACNPVSVALLDSAGAAAAAPYDVDVALNLPGATFQLFDDGACATPIGAVRVPASSASQRKYLRFDSPGSFSATASHDDFLSSAAVPVVVTGGVDAGWGGGSDGGGGLDGGGGQDSDGGIDGGTEGSGAIRLAFVQQPSDTFAGSAISPAIWIAVQDELGNTVTSSNAGVTLALGENPVGGTLSGTTTANAVEGVATFSDLSIDRASAGYSLTASSVGLTPATSSNFAVLPREARLGFEVECGCGATGAASAAWGWLLSAAWSMLAVRLGAGRR